MAVSKWSVGGVAFVQTAVFFIAGWRLPWRFDPVFSGLCWVLAAGSLVLASASLLPGNAWWSSIRRVHSWCALAVLAYFTWFFTSAAAYLGGLYGRLGDGVGWAIMLLVAPAWLLLLPTGLWGLAATGGIRRTTAAAGGAVVVGLGLDALIRIVGQPPLPTEAGLRFVSKVAEAVQQRPSSSGAVEAAGFISPYGRHRCTSVEDQGIWVLASYVRGGRTLHTCHGGSSLASAFDVLQAKLQRVPVQPPVKVDVVVHRSGLDGPKLTAPFRLRPGIDGVCAAGACLAPWQLMAEDAYAAYRPVDVIQDLRVGVDPQVIRQRLGLPATRRDPWKELERATVESFLIDASGRAVRVNGLLVPSAAPPSVDVAIERAEGFLTRNQRSNGRFHYLVDPFKGPVATPRFSIARQAGTALALCEYGSHEAEATVKRALGHLALFRRALGDRVFLGSTQERTARLGPTALALSAFLQCRKRHRMTEFDELIRGMAAFLGDLFDPETGRFHPAMRVPEGEPLPGPHRLYADGQAVLSTVLLVEQAESLGLSVEALRDRARGAMDYTAYDYWPSGMRSFFFMEENWHCLAAKAALPFLRHDGYERFCLDLVRWRTRLVLAPSQVAIRDWAGAYHFGHLSVPYITPTAGFAEAASAAVLVARARREPFQDIAEPLRLAMAFLRRHQWTLPACFMCPSPEAMVGAFSETLASPVVRVDFVQHAMAGLAGGHIALGHGPAAVAEGSSARRGARRCQQLQDGLPEALQLRGPDAGYATQLIQASRLASTDGTEHGVVRHHVGGLSEFLRGGGTPGPKLVEGPGLLGGQRCGVPRAELRTGGPPHRRDLHRTAILQHARSMFR